MKLGTGVGTALALLGFAGNSLLCRVALREGAIDPASFTTLRLVSGALTLWLLARHPLRTLLAASDLRSALTLFLYAAPFSYAYVQLPAGTGALIVFGSVQATMLGHAIWKGERPDYRVWLGLALSLAGLVVLNLPGAGAPSAAGALSMIVAGTAWGVYSLRGRKAKSPPLLMTASNFVLAVPFTLLLSAYTALSGEAHLSWQGILPALASGALASGVGYSLWYAVLPKLTATQAAILQLLVPVIAALASLVLLSEPLSLRLVGCALLIVTGVTLAVLRPQQAARRD